MDRQKLINSQMFRNMLCVGKTKFYELRNTDPDFPNAIYLGRNSPRFYETEAIDYIEGLRPSDWSQNQ